jgi:hypothetical protein
MAIALGGRPDDSAKMVWSRGCIAYLLANRPEGNVKFDGQIASRPDVALQKNSSSAAAIMQQFSAALDPPADL